MRTMRGILVVAGAILLTMFAGSAVFISCSKKVKTPSVNEQAVVYHCPMHPNYLSNKPGNCPICGMKLVLVEHSGASKDTGTKRILYYRDAMNPSFTSDKPGKAPDGMDLVPVYEGADSGTAIRIDPTTLQNIGVKTEKAALRTLTRDIRTSATIVSDERRMTTITTKIMGYVEKLYVDYQGQSIRKGQPLYELYSPDLVSAQSEYLQAYRNVSSQDSGLLKSTRQRLLNWDVPESQIAQLEQRGTPQKTMTIVSPSSGIVTQKTIVQGQSVEPGMPLYTVVDFSHVWVIGDVYQQDVPLVKLGQKGNIELDYYPGEHYNGIVTYIAPELNRDTKTLTIRLELANTANLKIKPGMNATLTIHSAMNSNDVTVPEQAVIHSGLKTIVIVAQGNGYFEPREVTAGQTAQGYTEILRGISVGEDIVVVSQFLIDAESNLKAAVAKMNKAL